MWIMEWNLTSASVRVWVCRFDDVCLSLAGVHPHCLVVWTAVFSCDTHAHTHTHTRDVVFDLLTCSKPHLIFIINPLQSIQQLEVWTKHNSDRTKGESCFVKLDWCSCQNTFWPLTLQRMRTEWQNLKWCWDGLLADCLLHTTYYTVHTAF